MELFDWDVVCKSCHKSFGVAFDPPLTPEQFKESPIPDKQLKCPHCGQTNTYRQSDYRLLHIKV